MVKITEEPGSVLKSFLSFGSYFYNFGVVVTNPETLSSLKSQQKYMFNKI
jgi:hypothetical protein